MISALISSVHLKVISVLQVCDFTSPRESCAAGVQPSTRSPELHYAATTTATASFGATTTNAASKHRACRQQAVEVDKANSSWSVSSLHCLQLMSVCIICKQPAPAVIAAAPPTASTTAASIARQPVSGASLEEPPAKRHRGS
jgi:hypothetical protein